MGNTSPRLDVTFHRELGWGLHVHTAHDDPFRFIAWIYPVPPEGQVAATLRAALQAPPSVPRSWKHSPDGRCLTTIVQGSAYRIQLSAVSPTQLDQSSFARRVADHLDRLGDALDASGAIRNEYPHLYDHRTNRLVEPDLTFVHRLMRAQHDERQAQQRAIRRQNQVRRCG